MEKQALNMQRTDSQRRDVLLFLLMLSTGVCTLLGDGKGGHILRSLWCLCQLVQLPLLFFALGSWFREKVDTIARAGRLGVGLVLLYGAQKTMIFWAGAIRQTQPEFALLNASDPSWLFLALAACLPLGLWLDRWHKRGLMLACAAVLGCVAGCCPVLGDFLALSRFAAFFPFFLLGRWADWEQVEQKLCRRRIKLVGVILLAMGLGACLVVTGPIFAQRTLLQGNAAHPALWGGALRLIQYAAAVVLGGALLARLPRRLPRLAKLGRYWPAPWFWLPPLLCLCGNSWLLPKIAGGTRLILQAILVCCLLVLVLSNRWAEAPLRAIVRLPGELTGQNWGRLRTRPNRLYWRSFLVVFLILLTAFSSYFIANNRSMIWMPDGQNLYFTILCYTRDYIAQVFQTLVTQHQLVLPQWDFSIGQGSGVMTVFHFNPLFLLAVLTPASWMEGVYGAVTVLQIGCAGLAFTVYCRSIEKRAPLPVLVGSVVYAFSGFVIFTAAKHIYFITFMVIYLPLILAGCERWLRKRKWGLFVGMIFLAMVGGYYYAFINTLLMAVYLIIREIAVHRTKVKRIVVDLLQLVGLYLWGFALALVVFLPSILSFFDSSRSDVTGSTFDFLYPAKHYLQIFLTMVGNNPSGTYWVRLGFAGVVFSAAVVLFLRWRDRALAPLRVGALVLFACLCVPLMGKIFNGFGYVTNRWSYGFAFCMALIVVCLLPRLVELRVWEQVTLAAVTAGYIAAVCWLESSRDGIEWQAMVLLALVTLTVILASHWNNHRIGQGCVALVTVAAVLVNLFLFYDPTSSQALERYMPTGKAEETVEHSAEAVASDLEQDGFGRVEVEGNRSNRFCLTGGYGTMSYWSVLDANLVSSYLDFDLNTVRQSYAVWGLDERASLCALSSVKYFVGKDQEKDGTAVNLQPYGFQAVGKEGNLAIYQNQYALPVGYTYSSYQTWSDYAALSPLDRQQAVLQNVVVEDADEAQVSGDLTQKQPTITSKSVPWTVVKSKHAQLEGKTIQVKKADGSITLDFRGTADAETYVYLKNLTMEDGEKSESIVRVSGNSVAKKSCVYESDSLYHFQRDGVTFNLGYSVNGLRRCRISFEHPGTYSFDDLQVVCLPMEDYVRDVTERGQTTLQNVAEENGTVSGTIHLADTQLLTLSIPYRDSWTVTVDGKPVKNILRVNGMYIGVLLEPGDHTVTAQYQLPGLKISGVVSGTALVLSVCIWVGGAVRHRSRQGGKRRRQR